MSSSYVPAGPEAAPSAQPSTSQTPIPQTSSSSTVIPPGWTTLIAVFLTLFTLAVLGLTFWWARRRRIASKMSDKNPSKLESERDVEALVAIRPIIPVTPIPEVRWTPQIRSISSPVPDEASNKKPATLYFKRARSPPPSNFTPRIPFQDPSPKSAPARAPSFSQNEPLPEKARRGELDPPVTPQALAVSGMETRSLGRQGTGLKS